MSEPATRTAAVGDHGGRRPDGSEGGLAASVAPWFAVLGGAAAWALRFVVAYALAEVACRSDRLDVVLLGLPAHDLLAHAATLIAAATAVGAAFVARSLAPEGAWSGPVDAAGDPEAPGRLRFIARTGVALNLLFLVAILVGDLPYHFLRTCGGS